MSTVLEDAAASIASAKIVIGFTGAGVSVESGLPDFRTLGTFWDGFDPKTFEKEIDNREAFEAHPERVWGFFLTVLRVVEVAEPNDGHRAMARLGRLGRMAAVITQNVDGLHQKAGSTDVIEFHGNIMRLACLKCGSRSSWHEVREREFPPRCRCGAVLKPEVPLFGDEVNLEAVSASTMLAMNANLVLVAGTHGEIAPVNRIPLLAKEHGATIVEVNKEKSLYSDRCTNYFLQGLSGELLPRLTDEVERCLAGRRG